MRLFADTLSANKKIFVDTLSVNKKLFADTLSANKKLFADTQSANKKLFADTKSANKRYLQILILQISGPCCASFLGRDIFRNYVIMILSDAFGTSCL